MNQTTELTIVLRAREGEHIGDLAPFLKAGSTVAIGRSGAVVTSVCAGNQIAEAQLLASQIVIAESAMRRGVQIPDDYAVVSQPQFNLDDHIRMTADARRYQWLRDKTRVEDIVTDLSVTRDLQGYFGTELDAEVDDAMRMERLLEKHGEPV